MDRDSDIAIEGGPGPPRADRSVLQGLTPVGMMLAMIPDGGDVQGVCCHPEPLSMPYTGQVMMIFGGGLAAAASASSAEL